MSIQEIPPAPPTEAPSAADASFILHPSSFILFFRAWWSLVCLSWRRQAKARQMVGIALGLMAFAVALVAVNTAAGRWGMHHWRYPRRSGPDFVTWVNEVQTLTGVVHRSPGAHSIESAVCGACHVILSPTARDAGGQALVAELPDGSLELRSLPPGAPQGGVLALSAFQVFSQWVVFSIFLTFLLPVWSLSFATEALGGERESQSLIWLLSRPLPRPAIYLAKFTALLPWSVGLNVIGFAALCLAAGPPGRTALRLYWPAVVWATLAFSALFLLLGAYFRRPAVVAIVYSFCLEVVLGNMPGYLKRVSIGFYTRCLMYESAGAYGIQADKPSVFLPVSGATALLVLVGGTAVLLAVGMWVFSRSQYHELE